MPRPAAWLTAALLLACANTAYLSWRYLALRHGWTDPGSGACSWSAQVDCDPVLLGPEARWFFFPNALLGLGFFLACALGWIGAHALDPARRRWVVDRLCWALAVACLAAAWFTHLLLRLPHLCPLCPWNHVLTLVAFVAALRVRGEHPPGSARTAAPGLAAWCLLLGAAVPAAWWIASGR